MYGDLVLTGMVCDGTAGGGSAIVGARVAAVPCVPPVLEAWTAADGRYTLRIPAESANACAELTIEVSADGYLALSYEFALSTLRAQPHMDFVLVRAASQTPTPTPTLQFTPTATRTPTPGATPTRTVTPTTGDLQLYGVVYEGSTMWGAPIPGARVAASVCVPGVFETTTGPDGSYTLFVPASYANPCFDLTMEVTAEGYLPLNYTFSIAVLRVFPERNFVLRRDPAAATPSPTASATVTPSATASATATPSETISATATPSSTSSATATPTLTPSATPTPTGTIRWTKKWLPLILCGR